jgi:hypothetical protein
MHGAIRQRDAESSGTYQVEMLGAASWTSLAATTVGLDDFGRLRVGISARVEAGEAWRLVVQAYSTDAEFVGGLPSRHARPLAAAQRATSAEELKRGVMVGVVLSSKRYTWADGVRVVAWLEPGAPDLDFDGLCARPAGAVYVGACGVSSDRADLVLERSAA